MTTPPTDGSEYTDPAGVPSTVPAAAEQPAEAPFDPYRFGAPTYPVPPEYAPPGYVPPAPQLTQPLNPPLNQPTPDQPYGSYPQQPYAQQPYPPQQYPQQYPYAGQHPGQQNFGPPPPWATQYPAPRTGNGKAITALVFGIASVVFFWTSLIDVVPILLAVIFGIIALNESRRLGLPRGMAITGLVLGVIGAVLAVSFTVIIYTRFKPCLDNYNSGSAEYNACVRSRF